MRRRRGAGGDPDQAGQAVTVWVVSGDAADQPIGRIGTVPPGGRRPPARRRSGRWWWALGVFSVVVSMVAVLVATRRPEQSSGTPNPTSPATAGSVAGTTSARSPDPSIAGPGGSGGGGADHPPVSYPNAGVLTGLGVTDSVFAFTAGAPAYPPTVVRVDLASGAEVDTELPTLDSTGPVSLVADPQGVIVRPWDAVPGYRVEDGEPPDPLAGLLANGGPALPGPQPGTIWVPAAPAATASTATASGQSAAQTMVLVDTAGRHLGPRIALGPGDGVPVSDGAGGIVVTRDDGTIVALSDDPVASRPGTAATILDEAGDTTGRAPSGVLTTGSGQRSTIVGIGRLIAAGPSEYVALPCPFDQVCPLRVIDRAGRLIRTISIPPQVRLLSSGQLSPDGTELAVTLRLARSDALSGPSGHDDSEPAPTLAIIRLTDGDTWQAPWISPNPDGGADALAWTSDSRWLLVTTGAHQLVAVSSETHDTHVGLVQVPYLTQLSLRPGG